MNGRVCCQAVRVSNTQAPRRRWPRGGHHVPRIIYIVTAALCRVLVSKTAV